MSDKDKRAEYSRKAGVKKNYIHEQAYELGLYKSALKQLRANKRLVKREGDIPRVTEDSEKPSYRTVTVTNAQHKAYKLITTWLSTHSDIRESTLRQCNIREATIKVLVKKKLIEINDGVITLYKEKETDAEIMSKHGVGKIRIDIGV